MNQLINTSDNRRFFRVKCDTHLCTQVTILKINNRYVNTGTNKVCVEDISSGGLKFLSNLDFPVNPHMVIQFSTIILNNPLSFDGIIIRKTEIDKSIFEYGVEFMIEEHEIKAFTRILNTLNYNLKKEHDTTNSNFCTKNKMECLKISANAKEKRAYFRFHCPSPICGKMLIVKINNKIIRSDSDNVCIEDIGAGGLRFLTYLDLPAIDDILYSFQLNISNKKLFLTGYIVRKRVISNDIFEYGIKLHITNSDRKDLFNIVQEMKININQKATFSKSTFCSKSKLYCLRS